MKTKFVLMGVTCIVHLTLLLLVLYNNRVEEVSEIQHLVQAHVTPPAPQTTMNLTSSAFGQNQMIPSTYTCDAANSNPDLAWSGVPAGTASLALIMDDPDVPKTIRPDGLWAHLVAYNISPDTTMLKQGARFDGRYGKNSAGDLAYGGPCPPDKMHRYFFRIYALDTILDLPEGASKEEVVHAMKGHILSQASLIGLYERVSSNTQTASSTPQ